MGKNSLGGNPIQKVAFIALVLTLCGLPADAKRTSVIHSHGGKVFDLVFSPDNKQLASTSVDQTIKLWDATTGQEINTIDVLGQDINSLAFNPDGETIAAYWSPIHGGGDNRAIKLFDLSSGKELRNYKGHASSIYCVAFSPDGKTMASSSADQTIRVWDVATGRTLHVLTAQQASGVALQITFSPDGKRLAAVVEHKLVCWDVSTGKQIQSLDTESDAAMRAIAFSGNGKRIACSGDHVMQLWDSETGKMVSDITIGSNDYVGDALSFRGNNVVAEGFTMDGKGGWTKSAEEWKTDTGKVSPIVEDSDYQVMRINSAGTVLASVSFDDTSNIRLRDVATGKELRRLVSHPKSKSATREPRRHQQTLRGAAGVKIGKIEYLVPKNQSDAKLERIIEKTFFPEGVPRENPPARYVYNVVDLNGDRKPELLVLLRAKEWCGTGGCTGLIVQPSQGYRTIGRFNLAHELPVVSNTRTSGWNDLIMSVYGGGEKFHYTMCKWNGKSYPRKYTDMKAGQTINGINPEGYECDGIQLPITKPGD